MLFFLPYNAFHNHIIAQPLKSPWSFFFFFFLPPALCETAKPFHQKQKESLQAPRINTQETEQNYVKTRDQNIFYFTLNSMHMCGGDFLTHIPLDKNLSASMRKQPRSLPNVSKPWRRVEISWLRHAAAYYSSNQDAYAEPSYLARTIESAPHHIRNILPKILHTLLSA